MKRKMMSRERRSESTLEMASDGCAVQGNERRTGAKMKIHVGGSAMNSSEVLGRASLPSRRNGKCQVKARDAASERASSGFARSLDFGRSRGRATSPPSAKSSRDALMRSVTRGMSNDRRTIASNRSLVQFQIYKRSGIYDSLNESQ